MADIVVELFLCLCENTGLRWGPSSRDQFFFRPPQLHLVEFAVFHVFVYVLYRITPSYCRDVITTPLRVSMPASWLNRAIGAVYLACWLFQVFVKAVRPTPLVQLCWLFMPCHLITLVWVYVFLYSSPQKKNYWTCVYLASMATAFHWGPVSAALFPDWSDHQFKIEGTVFVVHHGLLVLTPLYFAVRYQLLPFTWRFLVHATWVATLINVGPYTLISYLSGLNLNYHLYPPPKVSKMWIFATPYYRFYVILALIGFTAVFVVSTKVLAAVVTGTARLFGVRLSGRPTILRH